MYIITAICVSKRAKRETSSVATPPASGSGSVSDSPYLVQLSGATTGQQTVTWEPPAFLADGSAVGSAAVTNYKIYWRAGASPVTPVPYDLSSYTGTATVSSATFTYNITGLTAGQELSVRVTAINANGESNPSPSDVRTTP